MDSSLLRDPPPATCVVCGLTIDDGPDAVPDPPDGPMCGACARARQDDETLWELDWAAGDD